MTRLRNFSRLAALSLCALALAACSKKPEQDEAASILQFVPADTPYVMAALEPAPKELADKLEPQLEMMMGTYRTIVMRVSSCYGARHHKVKILLAWSLACLPMLRPPFRTRVRGKGE